MCAGAVDDLVDAGDEGVELGLEGAQLRKEREGNGGSVVAEF